MGEARRRREAAERRKQQNQVLLRRLALPGSLAVVAGVVAVTLAHFQFGGTPAHAAEGPQPRAVAQGDARILAGPRPPAPDEQVRIYEGGREQWRAMPLREVARGKQFLFNGQLFRVNPEVGALELVHGITERDLDETLKPYVRATHRSPDADDVVRLLARDQRHVDFRRLRTVEPGSRVCFQNAIYEAVALDGYLQIRPTGDVFKPVTRTYERPANTIVDLTVQTADGRSQTLHGTPEHPFYAPSVKRFVPMGKLSIGTAVRTSEGTEATVTATSTRKGEFKVYNFEVADTHTYYVSETEAGPAIWVHNQCGNVHIDVGGEGRYPGAINLNPGRTTSTTGTPGRPIPNLVRGRGEQMPFGNRTADIVSVENAPIRPAGFRDPLGNPTPGTAAEIARVVKPGGEIRLTHAPGPQGAGAHPAVAQATGGQIVSQVTDAHGITTTVIRVPGP